MNLIDMDKTTADSAVIQTIVSMLSACHAKHSDACMAPNCAECLARYFNAKIYDHLHDIITDATPADVAPVVHGHFEWQGNIARCSVCGEIVSIYGQYCQSCGAKMDEIEDNNNE